MIEPIFTWNLFWTTIIVPASIVGLGWYLTHLENKRNKKIDERNELMEENKKLISDELISWRTRFANTQCQIKNTVEEIKESLNGKVEVDDCVKRNDDIWAEIKDIRHTQYEAKK
jgi:hypothetical protein